MGWDQEHLLTYKNWAILLSTFFSVPLCIVCNAVNLNLTWTYYFTGILISRPAAEKPPSSRNYYMWNISKTLKKIRSNLRSLKHFGTALQRYQYNLLR
jgi:hypothetical protein